MSNSTETHPPSTCVDNRRPPADVEWRQTFDASGLGEWLAVLSWFETVDAGSYNWVVRASGRRASELGWEEFAAWIVTAGGAEWMRTGRHPRLVLAREWVTRAEASARTDPAWAEAARAGLVEAWLTFPDNRFIEPVTLWARDLGRWDLLDRIWRERLDLPGATRYPEAIVAYRSLPDGARRQFPALTWAASIAEARSSDDPLRVALRTVIHDGVLLHSSWYLHDDLDAALFAGTIWMYCQRMLPGDGVGRALTNATRTGAALERLIADNAQRGVTPTDSMQTVFAVVAALTALAQGDLALAASRGGLATILKGAGPDLDLVARGIVQLSQAIGGVAPLSRTRASEPGRDGGGRSLIGRAGWAMMRLADGLRALDRLDREGCDEALRLVREEEAWGMGIGTIHAYLTAVHDALWVCPESALAALDATTATYAGRSPEAQEPLGARLIGRARSFVLCRLGAVEAAREAAADLAEPGRRVAQARAEVYAGNPDEAMRVATEGLLDARTWLKDRLQLTVLKNAAAVVDPMASPEERTAAAQAILATVSDERALLALSLPRKVREAILADAGVVATESGRAAVRLARARLVGVVDAPDSDAGRVRLTAREQVLLPLLATAQTVPEIARSLHVSPNTVRKQVASLREKFQAGNRADLIRRARHAGLLH